MITAVDFIRFIPAVGSIITTPCVRYAFISITFPFIMLAAQVTIPLI